MAPTALPKSFEKDGCSFTTTTICKCVCLCDSRPNLLKPIPEKTFKNLTELHLSGQGLKSFIYTDDLSRLQILDLSHNEIPELPGGLKSSTFLRVLNLSHNRLTEFPKMLLDYLTVLKNLNLSFNRLGTLPRPACIQHLNALTARSCQLHEFPRWIISERHCLLTLDLSMNPIFENFPLDERFFYHSFLTMLKNVNFSNTYLSERVRTLFSQLISVEYLDVSNYGLKYCNRLSSAQELLTPNLRLLKAIDLCVASNPSLEGCTKLEMLSLANNPMSWIDSHFPTKTLRVIVVPNCYICTLPDNFGDMVNLEYLNLSHNDVSSLPPSFVKLTNLKHLDLYQNSLILHPEELGSLKRITCLDLCQNYFEPPSHPLGDDCVGYEELKGALRDNVAESRCNGMIPQHVNEVYLSDDDSEEYKKYDSSCNHEDTDDEHCESEMPAFIRPLPVNHPEEENWDSVEPNINYGLFPGLLVSYLLVQFGMEELQEYVIRRRSYNKAGKMPLVFIYQKTKRGKKDAYTTQPNVQSMYSIDWRLQRERFQEFRPSSDLNELFSQYLQFVPERIRNSPFYYHTIDTTSKLSTVRQFSKADIVDGQFDD